METIIDFIHGYQPFTNTLIRPWVLDNIEQVFIPTSRAMSQNLIAHNFQLQGWTIDAWLQSSGKIKQLGKKCLDNLAHAVKKDFCTPGFSNYCHSIIPLLNPYLGFALNKIDYQIIEKYIGTPTWFWFPEGAVDPKSLTMMATQFPDTVFCLPHTACPPLKNKACHIDVGNNVLAKCIFFSVQGKDFLMNSYITKDFSQKQRVFVTKALNNASALKKTLHVLMHRRNRYFIARDWENGESKNSLHYKNKIADISAFIEGKEKNMFDFKLINKITIPKKTISINKIRAGAWEPVSTPSNPYPYWAPVKSNEINPSFGKHWKLLLDICGNAFCTLVKEDCGKNQINYALTNDWLHSSENTEMLKTLGPAFLSCFPWHYYAPREWSVDPLFSLELLEIVIAPKIKEFLACSREKVGKSKIVHDKVVDKHIKALETLLKECCKLH